MWTESDEAFMQLALEEARLAAREGEVPVGAVIVYAGREIARGRNQRELSGDPTAHAEVLALRRAAVVRGGWRLDGARMYVTLEPCPMCAGAIMFSRLSSLIYGTDSPVWGAAGSVFNIINHPTLNHQLEVIKGLLAAECRELLRQFFSSIRHTAPMTDQNNVA